ncbi:MAG: peptidoglycan-binding protein [Pseudomonadota bacterium]
MLGAALATPVLLFKIAPLRDMAAAPVTQEGTTLQAVADDADKDVAIAIGPVIATPEVETLAPAIVEVPRHDPTPADQVVAAASAPDPTVVDRGLEAAGAQIGGGADAPAGTRPAQTPPMETAALTTDGPEALSVPGAVALDDLRPVTAPALDAVEHASAWLRRVQPGTEAPVSAPPKMLAGALEEDKLALSRAERRTIQLGLAALGHSPNGADGVFGPRTRAAIEAWQTEAGLDGDGYVLAEQREELIKAGSLVLARMEARRAAAEPEAPQIMPFAKQPVARAAPGCARDSSGTIIENQSISCDLAVLREGLSTLFGKRG